MVKLIPSVSVVWILQVATLVTANCISHQGPSPYEYDIDKQIQYRDNLDNLVAGWRQYNDKLLFKGNFTVNRNTGEEKEEWQFPPLGEENSANITYFVSLDISKSSSYYKPKPYLIKGGVGFKNVALGYSFNLGYGIDHWIEIYGQ